MSNLEESTTGTATAKTNPRLVFMANCLFGYQRGGGDMHFFQMARTAIKAGWHLHFFGSLALQNMLREEGIVVEQTLTDHKIIPSLQDRTLGGKFRLLTNNVARMVRALYRLREIRPDDTVYAVTDYWFDALPLVFCRATKKRMILGMDAPTLKEIIWRTRPDVTAIRLDSIHYWLSQNLSLRLFRRSRNKVLYYVHPLMKPRLLRMGYRDDELVFISNGMNLQVAEQVPAQKKEFDVIWLGRIHQQKGIDDLLAMLVFLAGAVADFRAVLVGRLGSLSPRLQELNLLGHVTLAGMVSEEEKYRLFKASRVFPMPSRQESWGIVIAEALACNVPVVAYDLPAYRPIYGDLVDYVPPFDFDQFKQKMLETVLKSRQGEVLLNTEKLATWKTENSWEAVGRRFLTGLNLAQSRQTGN